MGIHMRGFGGPFAPGAPGVRRMMDFGPGSGPGIVRLIVMIGFFLLLAIVAYLFIRHFDHNQQHHLHTHATSTPSSNSADGAASEVLKMRFAKGEIDEDEFTRRMNLLKEHQSVS